MTFLKLENIVREEEQRERIMAMGDRKKSRCLCHAPWCGIRNKYVKIVPHVKKTTRTANDVMLHLYRVHVYSLHVDWMESAEKQTNARFQIFNTTTLGLLHKLDGSSMSTHAGRMRGQSLKHLPLKIHCELPHLHKITN